MSKCESFVCDHCEAETDHPMIYRLAQIADTDDSDAPDPTSDDAETEILTFDFCSTKCLHAWSMDMALDFPDVAEI